MPMRAPYTGSEKSAGKAAASRGSAASKSASDAAAKSLSSARNNGEDSVSRSVTVISSIAAASSGSDAAPAVLRLWAMEGNDETSQSSICHGAAAPPPAAPANPLPNPMASSGLDINKIVNDADKHSALRERQGLHASRDSWLIVCLSG